MLLACRLCLRLGIDDPEQWLEDVPQRVFELWREYFVTEPEQFGFQKVEQPPPIEQQIHSAMAKLGVNTGIVWPPR